MGDQVEPGVYIQESGRGPRDISGVPTATAAFLGETERGPVRPSLVTSLAEYDRLFGRETSGGGYLPYAVAGFFENGGTRLYVARIAAQGAAPAFKTAGDFTIRALGPGSWGRRVRFRIDPASGGDPHSFRLQLAYWRQDPPTFDPFAEPARTPRPDLHEDHDDLSVDPSSANYFSSRLTGGTGASASALAELITGNSNGPTLPPSSGGFLDEGGTDGNMPAALEDFNGEPAAGRVEAQGLRAIADPRYGDVALVYAPHHYVDAGAIAMATLAHCEAHRYRFAVVDSPNADPAPLDPRHSIGDSSYGAFYAPWIRMAKPWGSGWVTVPPGGHVLGVYARNDIERGVWTAPANAVVRGAAGLAFDVDIRLQEVLNPRGVNVIRRFAGRGIRVWGARTLSSASEWKYVPIRRLFIFLERSIDEGTRWAVFEPNDERLWTQVTERIRRFLRTQWQNGALLGQTEEDAFFVKCDRSTMTQNDIDEGRLVCVIGVAPVRPAEFVMFRIVQSTSESLR